MAATFPSGESVKCRANNDAGLVMFHRPAMQASPNASVRVGTVFLPAVRWRLRIGYCDFSQAALIYTFRLGSIG